MNCNSGCEEQLVGKVLGTVIPEAEDTAMLKDLKSEELYQFDREYGG